MNQIPLSELVAEKGQVAAAKLLGVSPAAISKALSSGRNIQLTLHANGLCEAQELKPFPAHAAVKKYA